MVEQGMLGAWPFDAASPRGRAQLDHDLANQQAAVRAMLAAIVPDAPVVDVLLELDGDARAPVRLLLRRADGEWSPGHACARRRPPA